MTLPQIKCIFDSTHRNRVLHRANKVIVAIYKQLYSAIQDPTNQYQNASSLLPYEPHEIEKLLFIDERERNES